MTEVAMSRIDEIEFRAHREDLAIKAGYSTMVGLSASRRLSEDRAFLLSAIRALQEENERLRETFAMRDKLVSAGVHLALSNSEIYNLDMSPAPAINSWHESEAKRLAREAYDEYEQAQIEQLQRDMDEEDALSALEGGK